MTRTTMLKPAFLLAAITLAACSGSGGGGTAAPLSTTATADQQINANTSDTALPVPINGGDIADNDLSDSALPMAL